MRTRIRTSLTDWSQFVLAAQGQQPAEHHRAILAALQAVSNGDIRRLILLLPPGSAKSTYASLLFPAWWMARHPATAVIAASHSAGLATHFGYGVRALLAEHGERLGVSLARDARAAGQFRIHNASEYFAVGVQGGVTGRRADLALIDDPIFSVIEAESKRSRAALWDWFRSDLLTRMKPQGRMVLVMARWHPDDLAGRLLAHGGWACLRLPALAEADDGLARPEGAALWPDWEDRDAVLEKRDLIGERAFASLYQQAPLQQAGRIFAISKIAVVERVRAGVSVRAWDLAGTAQAGGDGDWTAGVRLLRDNDGRFLVEDVRRVQVAACDVACLIRRVAEEDGAGVRIGLPQDPGQAGLFQIAALTRTLAGFRISSGVERGPKAVRAEAVASQVAGTNVSVLRGAWNTAFLEELQNFPDGAHDDQVDALSRAFAMLAMDRPPARFADLPFLAR